MTEDSRSPPATAAELVERHRDLLKRHADSDRPASWLTDALLAAESGGESGEQEVGAV
ncbi:hypothetical protein HSB1_10650 [Halogranum salarium B-1]|uniref:Uncharacterized protein n=1 Tax=Halogranum salarium B-1 TaxID=1210908 RepID=J3EYK1_9EURY|nr:hypothetical protein HSB1_10650 [Halogranum salarium B-1]